MGTGCRVFLVGEDNSIERISMARLHRLLHFDRRESLPEYAGKRVRCAMVFVEVAGRQVLAIQNIQYSILTFDTKGRVDKKEWEKGMRLGMDLLPPLLNERYPRQVIDAHHRFAQRRYEHEFKWRPSRKLEETIVATVFS
jgi:hypothetical protein